MNSAVTRTKSPEEWLAAAEGQKRGRFKIFLGYAPGVGKPSAC
jgi:two-component system sensor histidine kinase KdpD